MSVYVATVTSMCQRWPSELVLVDLPLSICTYALKYLGTFTYDSKNYKSSYINFQKREVEDWVQGTLDSFFGCEVSKNFDFKTVKVSLSL